MPDAILVTRHTRDLTYDLGAIDSSGRWTPARKAILLELIRRGALSAEEACTRYRLSTDELASMIKRDGEHGRDGLAISKLQSVGR